MNDDKSWLIFAILSAFFAALTTVFAKVGVEGVNSNLATAPSPVALCWKPTSPKGYTFG